MAPGRRERIDYEYERHGTGNLFMMFEPLAGQREVLVTERRTAVDYAEAIHYLVDVRQPSAEKIVLVQDNLNTHTLASLYEAFPPEEARRLIERLEVHYTPKHGSWLNMAAIELGVCGGSVSIAASPTLHVDRRSRCLAKRPERGAGEGQLAVTTADARVKLKRLYPTEPQKQERTSHPRV